MQVSAVLVTRGDCDMGPVVRSMPFDDVVVWDNSKRQDLKVYGRYRAAVELAKHDVIYVQDDDCLVDVLRFASAFRRGSVLCNMPEQKRPEYPGPVQLVGWGGMFEREAMYALDLYLKHFPKDDLFLRECDRVLTGLNKTRLTDTPFVHLDNAFSGRMGNEQRHLADLYEITRRVESLR